VKYLVTVCLSLLEDTRIYTHVHHTNFAAYMAVSFITIFYIFMVLLCIIFYVFVYFECLCL